MRLSKAHIRKYRSIRDTGEFEIEPGKTILVGPNEPRRPERGGEDGCPPGAPATQRTEGE